MELELVQMYAYGFTLRSRKVKNLFSAIKRIFIQNIQPHLGWREVEAIYLNVHAFSKEKIIEKM